MMKLCNLVDIEDNNIECVLLKVKEDARLDLIKLGYFTGNEEYMRLTKGQDHTCTIIDKDGKSFSWYWGISGHTLVTDETSKKGKLIQACIEEDFDIYIGDNKSRVLDSLHITSLEDSKNAKHNIELMYWREHGDVCVHKDHSYYKHFDTINSALSHFQDLGYSIYQYDTEIAETGCVVDKFVIEKIKENDMEIC